MLQRNPIDLSVNAPFPTDKIRVRVLGTTDDAALRRGQRRRNFWASGNRRAPAKIYEIELYGYQAATAAHARGSIWNRKINAKHSLINC